MDTDFLRGDEFFIGHLTHSDLFSLTAEAIAILFETRQQTDRGFDQWWAEVLNGEAMKASVKHVLQEEG
jgi:hypothetical protein